MGAGSDVKVNAMKVKIPTLLMGTSPFIGAGQFGYKAFIYYRQFYQQPENMTRLFIKSFELGVKAVQLLAVKTVEALAEAVKRYGEKPFVVYSTDLVGLDLKRRLEWLNKLVETEVVAIHAEVADVRDLEIISKTVKIIEDFGAVPGVATHEPGITIEWIERENAPVEVILAPLNKIGYAMEPSFEKTIEAITKSSRKIIAIKPLAAGKLKPGEAFEFVYKYVDSAAVGVTSEEEMRETYTAAMEAYRRLRKG